MRLAAAVVLMAGAMAWGQQVWQGCPKDDYRCMQSTGMLPLPECGRYQHLENPSGWYTNYLQPDGTWREVYEAPKCVPDMHSVKEKEWQLLLDQNKHLQDAITILGRLHDLDVKRIEKLERGNRP